MVEILRTCEYSACMPAPALCGHKPSPAPTEQATVSEIKPESFHCLGQQGRLLAGGDAQAGRKKKEEEEEEQEEDEHAKEEQVEEEQGALGSTLPQYIREATKRLTLSARPSYSAQHVQSRLSSGSENLHVGYTCCASLCAVAVTVKTFRSQIEARGIGKKEPLTVPGRAAKTFEISATRSSP